MRLIIIKLADRSFLHAPPAKPTLEYGFRSTWEQPGYAKVRLVVISLLHIYINYTPLEGTTRSAVGSTERLPKKHAMCSCVGSYICRSGMAGPVGPACPPGGVPLSTVAAAAVRASDDLKSPPPRASSPPNTASPPSPAQSQPLPPCFSLSGGSLVVDAALCGGTTAVKNIVFKGVCFASRCGFKVCVIWSSICTEI